MDYSIYNCKLMEHFSKICSIPHGSGNEKALSDYICSYASSLGLNYVQQDCGNVLVRLNASVGYENHPTVMLQGHLDMVCEKNSGVEFDFDTQGLETINDGKYIYANGTTLGGDDGFGISIMLTLMSADIPHPTLELLFTVDEEIGMLGVNALDYSLLDIHVENIINLDNEVEGVACSGSAGGCDSTIRYTCDKVDFYGKALKITIFGLAGGHSGEDIDKNRTSANVLMGKLLLALYEKNPFNLITIDGGSKRNAICRECTAVIAVDDFNGAKQFVEEYRKEIYQTLFSCDRHLKLHIDKSSKCDKVFSYRSTSAIITSMVLSPHGVLSRVANHPEMVESSTNFATISTNGDTITESYFSRACSDFVMDSILSRLSRLAKATDGEIEHSGRYPGWSFTECELNERYRYTYRKLFGKEAQVVPLHVGLECGMIIDGIKKAYGRTAQCISIGCNVDGIHTPNEKMEIESFYRTFALTASMLEDL